MKSLAKLAAIAALSVGGAAYAGETPSPPRTTVCFVNLKEGETLTGPVKVIFGMSGMGIAPAGVGKEGAGHHRLFINRPPFNEEDHDVAIGVDDNHKHYGKGQTETALGLPKGTHTLQMVFADYDHIPHDPLVVSEVISVTVQ